MSDPTSPDAYYADWNGRIVTTPPVPVHQCPTSEEGATTPCCGRTVLELPVGDRITVDADQVTCGADPTPPHAGLAKVIWDASRADEGTISATGANIVARAVLASDWLRDHDAALTAKAKAEALREAHDEIHRLDPPPYLDAPQYREGLVDGHGMAAAVCLAIADQEVGR